MDAGDRRWRPSLKLTIGVVLAGLILVTAAVLTTTSYLSTRSSLLQFSRDLIRQNAEVVREQVRGFLAPAKSAASLTLAFVDSGMLEIDDPESVERYFFDFLSVQPTVAMLNYGDARGQFIMVKRQPNGSLSTKIITIDDEGKRRVIWRHRNPGAPVGQIRDEVEDRQDTYDPRLRPWYEGAKRTHGLYWTGVYVFHTDQQPGVTAAISQRGEDGQVKGVLSVDIGLLEISHFLRDRIKVGKSGQAFLLDEKARLIGLKQVEKLTTPDEKAGANKRRLLQLEEAPSHEVAALAREAACEEYFSLVFGGSNDEIEPITIRYQSNGLDYVATLMPIHVGEHRRWIAGVVAQEDEFLAAAKAANFRSLITAGIFAAIAVLIGIILASVIARSLTALVKEAAKVQNMQIEPSTTQSRFAEVNEVLHAFEGMKTGLRAFEKYVPVKLVRQLVKQNKEASLGGEPRTLTIFFSDIRDFTSISEGMSPVELGQNLSVYLSAVTKRIGDRDGTVDKYIGDAVMAFWGAPHDVPDHAKQGCLAAFEALNDIRDLTINNTNMPEFFTRIGIHTAEVVVGNFGSDDRLNYTIIGDGVNLASRLEGVNKVFGTQILISEDTYDLVKDEFDTRRIGLITVKGRETPCVVYELIGPTGTATEAQLAATAVYEEALAAYLERDWRTAQAKFEEALEKRPNDLAAKALLERARECAAHPPPKEWTGVFSIGTK